MILYFMILAPIIIGVMTYLITRKYHSKILIVFQCLLVLSSFYLFYTIKSSGPVLVNLGGWDDGIAITLISDKLSSVLLIMLTSIYLILILFGRKKSYFNSQFGLLIMTLQGLLMGLFLSTDLFNLFVFLEVSTVVVSILIMFKKEKRAIYDAMIYLLVNVVGATFFLFGIGFIYKTFGILDIRYIGAAMESLESPKAMFLPYALIMTTLSLKTALMPLFSWLPKAHGTPSAPCVVSAILSGLYIKSGLYLFLRVREMFAPAIQLDTLFLIIGFCTAVIGAYFAIMQTDIKLILAYSTVSQIGLIMMGIHLNEPTAYWGSIYHIFNHAIFKSTLFLGAGIIIDEYGTRDIREIHSISKRLPTVTFAMILAVLGITGAPFFNGSISKYLMSYGADAFIIQVALTLTNLGTILCYLRFCSIMPSRGETPKNLLSKSISGQGVLFFMGFVCLITGLMGQQIIEFFFGYSATIDPVSYIEKAVAYFMLILLGITFYYITTKKLKFHLLLSKKFKQIELGFNGICTAICIYFLILLGTVTFWKGTP